jgi:hypothetical protein
MKRKLLWAVTLLIPVVIAGCLVSGTEVFVIDLEGFGSTPSNMQTFHVNLSDLSSDYEDNKDKLKSIDAVVLVGDVANLGAQSAGMKIYLSDDNLSSPSEVEDEATLIFESPSIPVGDTLHLRWADGMSYMRNFSELFHQVKDDGEFYLYGIPENSINIQYTLEIAITVTAGL